MIVWCDECARCRCGLLMLGGADGSIGVGVYLLRACGCWRVGLLRMGTET